MVDQNIKTLSYGIFGNAVRDLSNGVFSIFDENYNMYKQHILLTRKSQFNQANIDVKEERTNVSLKSNLFNVSQGLE